MPGEDWTGRGGKGHTQRRSRGTAQGGIMGNLMSTSFAPECNDLKQKYDTCFNSWYSEKFLKGEGLHNECEDFWTQYKECIDIHLAKQGIKPLLEEARKELPFENDGKPVEDTTPPAKQ